MGRGFSKGKGSVWTKARTEKWGGQNYRAQSKGGNLQTEKTAASPRRAQPDMLGEVNS